MRVVAGVDYHKGSHTAVFLDAVGHVIDRITFPTTEEGYERALAAAQRIGCTEWGVEGAVCYGYAFGVFARARGATVLEGSWPLDETSPPARQPASNAFLRLAIVKRVLILGLAAWSASRFIHASRESGLFDIHAVQSVPTLSHRRECRR
jgi:hypothetical protein